jgi:hypothetical protein
VLVCIAGKMLIEKLMSGLYMGDCARRLLLSFAQRASLFGDVIPEALTKKDSFTTAGAQQGAVSNTNLCYGVCSSSCSRHVALQGGYNRQQLAISCLLSGLRQEGWPRTVAACIMCRVARTAVQAMSLV